MKLATFWEENLNCAGACRQPIFWGTKDIRQGPPPMPCLYRIKEEYDAQVGPIGVTIFFAAVSVFFGWFFHCCLYCADPEAEAKKMRENIRRKTR